jgi:hypothetical protein
MDKPLQAIAGYRPNPPQGPYTVYAQQNAFFHSIKRDICPRKAFIADLVEQLTEFIEAGDHIILMLDGNSNMKNSDLSLALREIDMTEAILRRQRIQGPGTHKQNSTCTPIDGIWVAPLESM